MSLYEIQPILLPDDISYNLYLLVIISLVGECLAVDFERNLYSDGMDVLEHHLKPLRPLPGVVLEQSYLNRMAEGLKPLAHLAASNAGNMSMMNSSIYSGRITLCMACLQ